MIVVKLSDGFEIVTVAEEHLVVPIGEKVAEVKGITVLNDAAAYLIEKMKTNITKTDLVTFLMERYNVDKGKANSDITQMLNELRSIGLIKD